MGAVAFDTLKFSKKLIAVGFTEQQAETLATEQAELVDQKLATKYDIKLLEQKLEASEGRTASRIEALEQSTARDIRESEQRTASRIETLEQKLEASEERTTLKLEALEQRLEASVVRMTRAMGGIMALGIGVIAALDQVL